MDCSEFWDCVTAYLLGTLDSDSEYWFEKHKEECSHCSQLLELAKVEQNT